MNIEYNVKYVTDNILQNVEIYFCLFTHYLKKNKNNSTRNVHQILTKLLNVIENIEKYMPQDIILVFIFMSQ